MKVHVFSSDNTLIMVPKLRINRDILFLYNDFLQSGQFNSPLKIMLQLIKENFVIKGAF